MNRSVLFLILVVTLLGMTSLVTAQSAFERTTSETHLTQGTIPGSLSIDKTVGEEVCFTLTAKDKNGNVIRSWNTTGNATTITLLYSGNPGSTANTDTSTQSWNADPMGYSYAQILFNGTELTKISADEWSIPASDFDSLGQARVCLIHTRADTGVYLQITPTFAGLNQVSDLINFKASGITNFLVDLTSATAPTPNQVYVLRRYEIVVSPRDRYLNVSNEQIQTNFSARFPGEFESTLPGLSDIFSGSVFITGPTNYFLASRIERTNAKADQLQTVRAYNVNDPTITGETSPYEILSHAPNAFALTAPADKTELQLIHSYDVETFTWEKAVPQDPYTNIQISRFGGSPVSDVVTYILRFVDKASLTQSFLFDSDNVGADAQYSTNHGQLEDLLNRMSGSTLSAQYTMIWRVEATDGLYTTLSSPPHADPNSRPGYELTIKRNPTGVESLAPVEFGLHQNFPNPFNPSTNITYSIPTPGPVTLKVYDLLGSEIAILVNEKRDAGTYTLRFDARSLPSGIYLYKLQSAGHTLTKRMTLMK